MAGCFSKKKELNYINFEDFSNPWNLYSIFLCNESIDWIKWLMNKKLMKYLCVKCGNVACKLGLKRGLLLTYGLATRHACYAPATRRRFTCVVLPRRGGIYSTSQVTRDNLDTKFKTSKQRFICRSRIPTPGCQSMRKCVEECRLQYEQKPA